MPCSHRIDTAQRVVFVEWRGSFTAEEASSSHRSLRDNPEFASDFRALTDMRDVTKFELTNSELRAIAERSPYDGTARRAVVVDRTVQYGMARMYQAFRDEDAATFKVFEDMAEAREWLGLD